MLSVQSYRVSQPAVSFKQDAAKPEQKPVEKSESFKTHAGLKTGTVVAGISILNTLALSNFGKMLKGTVGFVAKIFGVSDEMINSVKGAITEADGTVKSVRNKYLMTIPVIIAVYAGCGALVDKIINDKRADFASKNKDKNIKDTVKDNKNAELTRNGNVYQKSNLGKKYGTAIGVAALPILSLTTNAIKGVRGFSTVGLCINMVLGAIGGSILGSITDKYANKGAKKFADRLEK